MTSPDLDAVILAAGRSTRAGFDKPFHRCRGTTLLERQIGTAEQAGASEVFISGRPDVDYSSYRRRVLFDDRPGCGPISGLIAGLRREKRGREKRGEKRGEAGSEKRGRT
jgi:molybdopterin-guanine dinucleotide biosynthesis protein A